MSHAELALRCLAALAGLPAGELEAPFRVEAGGQPIDVSGGNAAPAWHDLDGDGLADLLVGQFEQGCVRVYPNVGRAGAPRFVEWHYLRAGAELLKVPYG